MGERRGRGKLRHMNRGLMGMDNEVRIECGVWGVGKGRPMGKKVRQL